MPSRCHDHEGIRLVGDSDSHHPNSFCGWHGQTHFCNNGANSSSKGAKCPACKHYILSQYSVDRCVANKKSTFMEKYVNMRTLGIILFILASIFCLYRIYELNQDDGSKEHFAPTYSTKLKLISVFNRHGDRAPSDALPEGDGHTVWTNALWPYGLANLTEIGKMRQFRIGLELRRRYEKILDYNASHILALSSPVLRCQESISDILHGLFDIETTAERGRKLTDRYNADLGNANRFCFKADDLVHDETFCRGQMVPPVSDEPKDSPLLLPGGSGFPLEYMRVKIDLSTVPSLTWKFLNNCNWRKNNPSPVDKNLSNSEAIAQLKGINKLVRLLKSRYNVNFNFTTLGLWSTINAEVSLARTRNTIGFGDHYLDWINTALPEYKKIKITLFDLWEQVAVLGYRDRIVGTANHIQLGPMLTSLVQSQGVALAGYHRLHHPVHHDNLDNNRRNLIYKVGDESEAGTYIDNRLYSDKKMIIYSTHDSILQQLMINLSLIQFEPEDFETRFNEWRKSDYVSKLLAGLKMTEFGSSLVFELFETEVVDTRKRRDEPEPLESNHLVPSRGKKFPFVQALLYNEPDGKFKPVEYRRLRFGAACRRKFREIHQALGKAKIDSMLAKFRVPGFPLDEDLSCPFELFKQVTSAFMLQPAELNKLCTN